MKKKINLKDYAVWIMLVVLIIGFSIATPNFMTGDNVITVLRQVSNMGIIAVGMTFVLIAGGIDLSIGNQMGLVGIATALFMTSGKMSPVVACALGLLIGIFVGLVNGVLITYTHMPPLICTLGMSYATKGLAFILTDGTPVYGLPESMKMLGQGYILGIVPVCVLMLVIIVVVGAFILKKTHLGRQIYAVGSNEESARLSGLSVSKVRVFVYTAAGFMSAISGLVMMSRVNSGQALSGNGMEMDALIACVVGGISITGGEGNALGMAGGMMVMGVLANGMAVMGLGEYMQMLVKGLVLIAVVALDCWQRTHIHKKKD